MDVYVVRRTTSIRERLRERERNNTPLDKPRIDFVIYTHIHIHAHYARLYSRRPVPPELSRTHHHFYHHRFASDEKNYNRIFSFFRRLEKFFFLVERFFLVFGLLKAKPLPFFSSLRRNSPSSRQARIHIKSSFENWPFDTPAILKPRFL